MSLVEIMISRDQGRGRQILIPPSKSNEDPGSELGWLFTFLTDIEWRFETSLITPHLGLCIILIYRNWMHLGQCVLGFIGTLNQVRLQNLQ